MKNKNNLKSNGLYTTFKLSPYIPIIHLHNLLYFISLFFLFYHQLTTLNSLNLSSLLLLLSNLILAFMYIISFSYRWRPLTRKEFPEKLDVKTNELPALDVFICTADPYKEPPASVVSTALSVMAFDYPTEKLSVYVSDDGGSDITLFAFLEAAKFARYWLPFCRENGLLIRSPEAYFVSEEASVGEHAHKLKIMYQNMNDKIEIALEKGSVGNDLTTSQEQEIFKKWKSFTRQDHPAVIQVILESGKDLDISGKALPNLIYVSREKRPSVTHHFKAGALNALTRVSSTMTNSPMILTVDCDTYSNDPQTPFRALCYFLDPAIASDLAYVQFPQHFQGVNKNDIYAISFKRLFTIHTKGMDGIKGPNYLGTGTFFARRALHSSRLSPHPDGTSFSSASDLVLERAHEVASCRYEDGTKWGSLVGFRYGSLSEDFNTGFQLQCEGWKGVLCDPERPAFLGDIPKNLIDLVSQQRRWVVGQYELFFSRFCPLTYGCTKASLFHGFAYAYISLWGIWCIPVPIYAILPQLALILGAPLFPKVSDPWFYLYGYLFLTAYAQDLFEFVTCRGTIPRWWNDQRMWLIRCLTSCLFGTIQMTLKQFGVSASGFTVTNKMSEDEQIERYNKGEFDFGAESPFFVVLTTVALINLSSLVIGIVKSATLQGYMNEMFVQLFLSAFGVINCWPIYKALFFRSDEGRIQRNVKVKAFFSSGILYCISYLLPRN